jgi:ZIP family zinc transporter
MLGSSRDRAVLVQIVPALALIGGGVLGSRFHPQQRLRGIIAHLVGGLVLGTAAADLMPAASRSGHLLALAVGFCLGFSLVLTEPKAAEAAQQLRPLLILLLPFLVDSLIDGLVVGISSDATDHGWIIPLAVALEMGFTAVGVGTLLGRGAGRWRSTLGGALMAALYLVGLGISGSLANWLKGPALTGLLAFGTAALIYLVIEEVMKEAHADGEDDSGVVNLAFFVGLLVVWLLDAAQLS